MAGRQDKRGGKSASFERRLKPPTRHDSTGAGHRSTAGRETPTGSRAPSRNAGDQPQGSKLQAPPPVAAQHASAAQAAMPVEKKVREAAGRQADKAKIAAGQERAVDQEGAPADPSDAERAAAKGPAPGKKGKAVAKQESVDVRGQPGSAGQSSEAKQVTPVVMVDESPPDVPLAPASLQQNKAVAPERPVEPKEKPAEEAMGASGPAEQSETKQSEAAKPVAAGPPPAKPAAETSKSEQAVVRERAAPPELLAAAAAAKSREQGAPPAASSPVDPEGNVASFPVAFQLSGDYDSASDAGLSDFGDEQVVRPKVVAPKAEEPPVQERAPGAQAGGELTKGPGKASEPPASGVAGDAPLEAERGGPLGSGAGDAKEVPPKDVAQDRAGGAAVAMPAPGVAGVQNAANGDSDVQVVEEVVLIPTFGSGLTKGEVEELNEEFKELFTELGMNTDKYFTRSLDEFESPADFYQDLSHKLDQDGEEVDITETLATRLGDDHPLVLELIRREALEDVRVMDVHLKESLGPGKSKKIFVKTADEFRTPLEYYIFLQERTKKQGASLVPLMEEMLGADHPLPRALAASESLGDFRELVNIQVGKDRSMGLLILLVPGFGGDMPKTAARWQSWKKSATFKAREQHDLPKVKAAKAEKPEEIEHFGCMDCIVYWFGLK